MRRAKLLLIPIAMLGFVQYAGAETRVPATYARQAAELRAGPSANDNSVASIPKGGELYLNPGSTTTGGWAHVIYKSSEKLAGGFVRNSVLGATEIRALSSSVFEGQTRGLTVDSATGFSVLAKFVGVECKTDGGSKQCTYRVSVALSTPKEFTGYARTRCQFFLEFGSKDNRTEVKRHSTVARVVIPAADGHGVALEYVSLDPEFAQRYARITSSSAITCSDIETIALQ